MAQIAITRSVVNGQVFTQTQNETQMSDIESFINTTKLTGTDNIQNGSIITANLASGVVTAAKLDSNSVGTAAMIDSSVTTAKLVDASVTSTKLAAVNYQLSSSSGNFNTTSTSFVDITSLGCTITTTGRPVMITLIPDSVSSEASNVTTQRSIFTYLRDSTNISYTELSTSVTPLGFTVYDVPSAGTYTYKLQVKSVTGTQVNVHYMKLFVYQL